MSNAIQDFYPDDFAWCYGCGRLNQDGYQFKTRLVGDRTRTDFAPDDRHTALPGYVYGGLIASAIDCHSTGSAAIYAMVTAGEDIGSGEAPRFVTAHLDVDYLRPTPLAPFHVEGAMADISERKVIVDSVLTADGVATAKGHAVLVHVPEGFA